MSVLARYREESKFEVIDHAKEMEIKIYGYCMNEKYFPKKHRFSLTMHIIEDAGSVPDLITEAQREQPGSLHRRELQNKAFAKCENILRRIELAEVNGLPIPNGILVEITEGMIKEEKLLIGWQKSDKERAAG